MALRSLVATASAALAVLAWLLAAVGVGGIQVGALAPLTGFYLFALGFVVCSALALVTGLIGLVRTRASTGRAGRGRALLGTVLGAATLAGVVLAAGSGGDAPPIHDLTTDPSDPPRFSQSVANAEGRVNGTAYPDGGPQVPDLQRAAYPDLQPILLALPPDVALERARAAARSLGWTVTTFDPAAGRLEATDTSRIFRFVDDIVVRVGPAGRGAVLDVRSNSRVGQSDLGANAARIRAFTKRVDAATTP